MFKVKRSHGADGAICVIDKQSHGICAYLRDPWENKYIQPVL